MCIIVLSGSLTTFEKYFLRSNERTVYYTFVHLAVAAGDNQFRQECFPTRKNGLLSQLNSFLTFWFGIKTNSTFNNMLMVIDIMLFDQVDAILASNWQSVIRSCVVLIRNWGYTFLNFFTANVRLPQVIDGQTIVWWTNYSTN